MARIFSTIFIPAIFVALLLSGAARCEDDGDDGDPGARDNIRMDMTMTPPQMEFFPNRLDGSSRGLTERERDAQTEPLGEMRNWDEHPTPSNFDNRTLDLPFKEDRNDLPLITPKIHIHW